MGQPFDSTESAFTKTALTLTNASADQPVSFPIFGTAERQKINDLLIAVNQMQALRGVF